MKIFDLTRGHYSNIFDPYDGTYASHVEHMAHFSSKFLSLFKGHQEIDVVALLNNIPVFLVESSMAQEYVAVPGCECLVRVPEDNYLSPMDEFDIDKWLNSKNNGKDDPYERPQLEFTITDLLGVYIFSTDKDVIPRRIFIWMDKIVNYAKDKTKYKDANTVSKNACALFDFVFYHEMAHALMDVELYGVHPSPIFSYFDDYPYRFYEEAFANGIALDILMDKNLRAFPQQTFIKDFVKNQGDGYSYGWDIYRHYVRNLDQWMGMKVLFNYEVALLLRDMWKHKPFMDNFIETVGHDKWIAVKDHFDKWGIMELPYLKMVAGFEKYDFLWSFDENGLCMVRLDQEYGYLYGYINEQGGEQIPVEYEDIYSFENGITIAKKNGCYGAIGLKNQPVIPFNLPYEEVRGFRNGRAPVKNSEGKWGMIDTEGKEVVLCTKDRPFRPLLDKDSIIKRD